MTLQPETLLLRIRAETLRLNLKRAHAKLRNLPRLPGQFESLRQDLAQIRDEAFGASGKADEVRQVVLRRGVLTLKQAKDLQSRIDDLVDRLSDVLDKFDAVGRKSFLAQVTSVGQNIWECLEGRASVLQSGVAGIEADPTSADAWKRLTELETDAITRVFNESIELLGGIALRDTRFDADICELADELIRSMRASGSYPSVIPGGISSMMMTLERIIRLRFPEWTLWALPFAAYEFWLVSAHKQFDEGLDRVLAGHGARATGNAQLQRCLGDAFATYIMGPAYAFAAMTMLLNPDHAEDDLRAQAILGMLRAMDPAAPNGFAESYRTLAGQLEDAWKAARAAALNGAGVVGDAGTAAASVQVAVLTLSNDLRNFGYTRFDVAEWKAVGDWVKPLLEGRIADIPLSPGHDLRHVLSAAWRARVDSDRKEDISGPAMELAERVRIEMNKRPPDEGRGLLRGLE